MQAFAHFSAHFWSIFHPGLQPSGSTWLIDWETLKLSWKQLSCAVCLEPTAKNHSIYYIFSLFFFAFCNSVTDVLSTFHTFSPKTRGSEKVEGLAEGVVTRGGGINRTCHKWIFFRECMCCSRDSECPKRWKQKASITGFSSLNHRLVARMDTLVSCIILDRDKRKSPVQML